MDIEWDEIRKIIENKDSIAIAEAKMKVLDFMEKQALSLMKMAGLYQELLQAHFTGINQIWIKTNLT